MKTQYKTFTIIALMLSVFFINKSHTMQYLLFDLPGNKNIAAKRKKPCPEDNSDSIITKKRTKAINQDAALLPYVLCRKQLVVQFLPIDDIADIVCEYIRPSIKETEEGNQLLASAIRECDQKKIVHIIEETGANINGRVYEKIQQLGPDHLYAGITFLAYATRKGAKIAERLLEYNANPNIPDICKLYPLHHVQDVETAELLLQYNANIHVVDTMKKGVLHSIVDSRIPRAVPLIQTLIAHNADVEHKNNRGQTSLHSAAAHRNPSVVCSLLQAQANPCVRDHVGNTPLHLAVRKCHSAQQSDQNNTAIALINAGANPFKKNERDLSPLDIASDDNVKKIMIEAYEKEQSESM